MVHVGEETLEGGTVVGRYGGKVFCEHCIHVLYPNEMGQYVAFLDKSGYYIDGAITASEFKARLNQEAFFGKMRKMNSSERPGWRKKKKLTKKQKSNIIEANVEFVEVGFYDDNTLGLEIQVIKGKTIKPGDEIICCYPFPSLSELRWSEPRAFLPKISVPPKAAPAPTVCIKCYNKSNILFLHKYGQFTGSSLFLG